MKMKLKLKITNSKQNCDCCKFVNINGQTDEEEFLKICDKNKTINISKVRMKEQNWKIEYFD